MVEALALASVLARSSGGSLVVCTVVPEPEPSVVARSTPSTRSSRRCARRSTAKPSSATAYQRSSCRVRRRRRAWIGAAADVRPIAGARLGSYCSIGASRRRCRWICLVVPVALAPKAVRRAQSKSAPHLPLPARRLADLGRAGRPSLPGLRGAAASDFVVRDKQMYPTGAGYKAENLFEPAALQAKQRRRRRCRLGSSISVTRPSGTARLWGSGGLAAFGSG